MKYSKSLETQLEQSNKTIEKFVKEVEDLKKIPQNLVSPTYSLISQSNLDGLKNVVELQSKLVGINSSSIHYMKII